MENWTTAPSQGQEVRLPDRREEVRDAPRISDGSHADFSSTSDQVKFTSSPSPEAKLKSVLSQ